MLTEIATHPVLYGLLPVVCAVAAGLAAWLGALLCTRPRHHSVVTAHARGLAKAIAELTAECLTPQELLSRIDPEALAERIDGPLRKLVDETTVELLQRYKPDMWELLPLRVKQTVIERARNRAPGLAASVLTALEVDAGDVLELEALVDRALAEDPELLRRLVRELNAPILRARTGTAAVLGLVFGAVELFAAAALPALTLAPVLLVPLACRLAELPVRGYTARCRRGFTAAFAGRIADPVLGFANIVTELTSGARSDRVRALVRREVTAAIDEQASIAKPVVSAAIGATKFQHIKRGAADRAILGATALSRHVDEYADRSMQVRAALAYRLRRMPVERLTRLPRGLLRYARTRLLLCGLVLGAAAAAGQFAITTFVLGVR